MSDKQYARRAALKVTIDGHDATNYMAPSLLDFTYVCNAGGKADEVQIMLHNRDGRWSGDWKPKKGMPVQAEILCADWEEPGENLSLPCGSFAIDEITFSGPPDRVEIKAVSADLTGGLRDTQKTRAWENTSLRLVGEEIAGEYGLSLFYSGDAHEFLRQDQRNEGDLAFLNRLASQFGMSCKAHDGKLVIFDREQAEGQAAGMSIAKAGGQYSPQSYSFRESSSNTGYDKACAAYTDPRTGTTHKAEARAQDMDGGKTLTLQNRAESPAQAAKMARAALHDKNSRERTASVEIMGCPALVAGQTVALEGFGDFSATYFIKTATHRISGSGGYSTSLELSRPCPTLEAGASEEVCVAGIKAREEVERNDRIRTADVKIYAPGAYEIAEAAAKLLLELETRVEDASVKAESGTEMDKICAKTDALILCLPDIAESEGANEAESGKKNDAKAWLYLRDMFQKWLSGPANNEADECRKPLIIEWDWLYSYERVQKAYNEFVTADPNGMGNIISRAARQSLGNIISNNNPDPVKKAQLAKILELRTRRDGADKIYFDFINTPWDEWEALYYTLTPVIGFHFPVDGLNATLNTFSLRALASGVATRENGHWKICVEKVAVFAHDKFNFADSGEAIKDMLGCWNCEERAFILIPSSENDICLGNTIFRNFRERYGVGCDFLVLTLPHIVENFRGECYVY